MVGEPDSEMWEVYGELGYFSLTCEGPSGEEGDRGDGLQPELIFCRDEERDGGLGRVGGGVETEAGRGDR